MRNTLRFKSDRSNRSEPKEYFINECCFGDDLAAWLKNELEKRSYSVDDPVQEDWGWILTVAKQGKGYVLNIGYVPEPDDVWQVIVEPRIGLLKRLAGMRSDSDTRDVCHDLHDAVSRDMHSDHVRWLHMNARGVESDEGDAPQGEDTNRLTG